MAKSTPKLGQRSAASNWVSRGHVLSDPARNQLAGIVGLAEDPRDALLLKMFSLLSQQLGAHLGAVQALDNAPRAADYVSEFRTLKQHADALINVLSAANPRIMEDLEAELETDHSTTRATVESAIAALSSSTARRIEVFSSREHADRGGRPTQVVSGLLIDSLHAIFESYYRGNKAHADELQFIRVALADASLKVNVAKLKKQLVVLRQEKKPPE